MYLLIILIFALLMFGVNYMKKLNISFNIRVISALVVGIILGIVLQLVAPKEQIGKAMSWITLVGSGYVRLLRMIVFPLIFVSITKAIANQEKNVGRSAAKIMAVLMVTVAISALVGALTSSVFNLTAEGLQSTTAEVERGEKLLETMHNFEAKPVQQQILEIIPTNPFYALTGQGPNATLATVFFAAMLGLAALYLKRANVKSADLFIDVLNSFSDVIMRMVKIVLRLTPYGVMALMTNVMATSNYSEVLRLLSFILASYVAIIIMFIIHGLIIGAFGLNPLTFFRKSMPNFMFAFTSRSSSGTLPITITNMEENLGVPSGIANLAGSLGTSIGQNGCAGIYPAMLAVMIAPTVGIDPMSIGFLAKLVIVTTLGSFGIVGVGGGATFAAIVVLSSMGLPIELAGLLIAIEPLIDMGRTALNVSDSVVAGVVAAKSEGVLDEEIYNRAQIISE
ncbi:cation:dicarboxylase symporter family transporter [uncultured Ezakiella sp.]|uniref:L-cystine transporter n=1 Tax=uncultured Ezakiella sp. TaxID=1637529 RepID=UPI0025E92475|nr:cation:dicarboxylase symporter family transporter [uncultured Ezakiella sp.]